MSQGPIPPSDNPFDLPAPPTDAQRQQARERVQFPGLLLIVTGVGNLLVMGYFILNLVLAATQPAEKLHEAAILSAEATTKAMSQIFPGMAEQARKEMEKQRARAPAEVKQQALTLNGSLAAGYLLLSLFILFGGVRMLQMRGYGLAVFASILAAIPVTPCCCLGIIPALWSLVVLFNPDVRSALPLSVVWAGDLRSLSWTPTT